VIAVSAAVPPTARSRVTGVVTTVVGDGGGRLDGGGVEGSEGSGGGAAGDRMVLGLVGGMLVRVAAGGLGGGTMGLGAGAVVVAVVVTTGTGGASGAGPLWKAQKRPVAAPAVAPLTASQRSTWCDPRATVGTAADEPVADAPATVIHELGANPRRAGPSSMPIRRSTALSSATLAVQRGHPLT
jgi:hypothetical protein